MSRMGGEEERGEKGSISRRKRRKREYKQEEEEAHVDRRCAAVSHGRQTRVPVSQPLRGSLHPRLRLTNDLPQYSSPDKTWIPLS